MTGKITANEGKGGATMELLRSLRKDEILEVLSNGFCEQCEALVQARFRSLHKRKENKVSFSDDGMASPRHALHMPVNGDTSKSFTRRHGRQWDSADNSFRRRESTFLARRSRRTTDSSPRYKRSRRQSLLQSDFELLNDGRNGGSSFDNGLSQKQWDNAGNSFQKRESTFSAKRNRHYADSSPRYKRSRGQSLLQSDFELLLNDGLSGVSSYENELSEEQKERIRCSKVATEKDFVFIEKVNGRYKNVLQGLELHTKVFNAKEQKNIVDYIYNLQKMGKEGLLRERTYSEPRKWMRGKGRVTIQFGCCYNYAVDKNGNPPGIIRDEEVDPLPPLFKQMIRRMVRWRILPSTCIPNSCVVNIYDEGDCIPPHIDHHDFLRPYCTVSLLSECDIVFGSNLKVLSPGEFSRPISITLPVGSVLIVNGNGADIAKHCVPSVASKRISITFRKMGDSKLPYNFSPDPQLVGIKPLGYSRLNTKRDSA